MLNFIKQVRKSHSNCSYCGFAKLVLRDNRSKHQKNYNTNNHDLQVLQNRRKNYIANKWIISQNEQKKSKSFLN